VQVYLQTNTPGLGSNSSVSYTNRASVWGWSDLPVTPC